MPKVHEVGSPLCNSLLPDQHLSLDQRATSAYKCVINLQTTPQVIYHKLHHTPTQFLSTIDRGKFDEADYSKELHTCSDRAPAPVHTRNPQQLKPHQTPMLNR